MLLLDNAEWIFWLLLLYAVEMCLVMSVRGRLLICRHFKMNHAILLCSAEKLCAAKLF